MESQTWVYVCLLCVTILVSHCSGQGNGDGGGDNNTVTDAPTTPPGTLVPTLPTLPSVPSTFPTFGSSSATTEATTKKACRPWGPCSSHDDCCSGWCKFHPFHGPMCKHGHMMFMPPMMMMGR